MTDTAGPVQVTHGLKPCPLCGDAMRASNAGAFGHTDSDADCILARLAWADTPKYRAAWNTRAASTHGEVGKAVRDAVHEFWVRDVNKPSWFSRDQNERLVQRILAALSNPSHDGERGSFQARVHNWMLECFGPEIEADRQERADRFIEEALELAQTMPGFTVDRAHALVDYVFDRPVGERGQEIGGVMVTLAALCNTVELQIEEEAEQELARVWTKIEAIRAKQAAKPTGSALPVASPQSGEVERLREALEPFAAVLDEYDPDDEDDATPATLVVGSVTDYSLTLGDLRAASAALSLAREGGKRS